MVALAEQLWAQRIEAEEHARLMQYTQAWRAYFGQFKRPLKIRPGQSDDNVVVNFCRMLVDKSVMFLFGDEPQFELDEQEQTPAEDWLTECWRLNHKMQFLKKIALNGAVCGHVFVKIVPERPFPRLVNVSPEYVTVVTEPDDVDTVVRYRVQYPALGSNGEQLTIRQIIERDDAGRWHVLDQRAEGNNPFRTVSDQVWPWPWPPVVDCQNLPSPNEFYGLSDIESDVIALNDSINFLLSNIARILRFHAHPKTWARGCAAADLKIAVDETIVFQSPDAELHNLEMQSDLSSSLEFYKRLKEAIHEITQTPEVATGKLESAGALSGTALQVLYRPLLEKTACKRGTYGDMLVELNRRLLEMGGFGPDNITTINWPDLLPRDTMQERQAALIDQQLGASRDTLLAKLGYDPDLERQKRELGNADMAEQMLTAFDRDNG